MSIAKVLASVKKEVLPTPQEERAALLTLKPIIRRIQASIPHADVILGGSGAKGTWLKTFDVDVFVMFHYKNYSNRHMGLSDILHKALSKKFRNIQRLHGSRDYFRINENGLTFEVIPILKISKAAQAKNITDISPLHTKWVKKHSKLRDEIRLAKKFCKSNNLYGAESYIRGFSGYVCEILTVHYGSFLKLLKAASKWKPQTVIDVQGYYKKRNVFLEMNKSKLVSPLIVIDPVQHDRNAAAALSQEKFEHFIKTSNEFLAKPSPQYFREKIWDNSTLKKVYPKKKLIVVSLKAQEGKEDIVGSKMMKVYEHLEQQCERFDFKVFFSDWEWDKKNEAKLLFVFDPKPLSKTHEIQGPPLFAKPHIEKFRKMHRKTLIKNKRLVAIETRTYIVAEKLFASIIKNEYVKERAASSRYEVL